MPPHDRVPPFSHLLGRLTALEVAVGPGANLAPLGHVILAVHISNCHLGLEPVFAALAERVGLVARLKRYRPEDVPPPASSTPSDVVRLASAGGPWPTSVGLRAYAVRLPGLWHRGPAD